MLYYFFMVHTFYIYYRYLIYENVKLDGTIQYNGVFSIQFCSNHNLTRSLKGIINVLFVNVSSAISCCMQIQFFSFATRHNNYKHKYLFADPGAHCWTYGVPATHCTKLVMSL